MAEEPPADQALEDEIASLERRLREAKAKRTPSLSSTPAPSDLSSHALLVLADSALPLGSFAFSSGLESYLAHHRVAGQAQGQPASGSSSASFHRFLRLSLASAAATTLPYVLAAHRDPTALSLLTSTLDACLFCPVARRASTSQGRALLTIWERSLAPSVEPGTSGHDTLDAFRASLRGPSSTDFRAPAAHFAPAWGVVSALLGLAARQAAYVFVLGHAKAVLSAAVRAGVMGPYQAQAVLASPTLQRDLVAAVDRNWDVAVEDAAQTAPVLDLWVGRHELLYSRIFNS
ncbi:MAG: hypothetical protein M1832_004722 [Thelocarpon impressellum]|nr:MAG: hypothetical protein M1832_004722 [Thelocarpon impressellum]